MSQLPADSMFAVLDTAESPIRGHAVVRLKCRRCGHTRRAVEKDLGQYVICNHCVRKPENPDAGLVVGRLKVERSYVQGTVYMVECSCIRCHTVVTLPSISLAGGAELCPRCSSAPRWGPKYL